MALRHVQKTYEEFGRLDPLYAVLSAPNTRGNRWDPEAFFATGRKEITAALHYLRGLGLEVRRGRALDFGCGAGRLSQALAREFEEVVGVDIAYSMIECAERYNRCGQRCRFVVNTTDNLAQFDSASFDFVYSNISLQHSPPEASRRYIAEFFRVLRPGGVAHFQIPAGRRHEPGTFGARVYAFRHGVFKRFWKRLRGRPPVELHYLNQGVVEEIIQSSGGRLIQTLQEGSRHSWRVSMFYTAVRD